MEGRRVVRKRVWVLLGASIVALSFAAGRRSARRET